MTALAQNLERLEEEIALACRNAGRPRAEVELMAVSKTYPAATMAEAAALGLTLFGENRVREFAGKALNAEALRSSSNKDDLRVHLIGHLQSNKALRAVELFDGIDDETKAGLDPDSVAAAELLERLPELDHLQLRGLMTIAPFGVSDDQTRACFRSLRQWRDRWAAAYARLAFDVLSMGMSGDFDLAIEEGATRIRVGTSLFGRRPALGKK